MRDLQELYKNFTNQTQTPTDIILTILPSFYQTFASALLSTLLVNNIKEQSNRSYLTKFSLDIVLIVIPLILDLTILDNEGKYLQHVFFAVIVYLSFIMSISKPLKSEDRNTKSINNLTNFVTNSRSVINLIAVVAILAVDFIKVFPNRFRKTHYFGYSLMDIGVGLYVFSNGIVAPELHKPVNSIMKSVISSIPIIVLGLIRLVLVTVTHYTVSPKEYGLHWNFFMTLAVTKILSSVILNFLSIKYSLLISIATLFLHEYLLQTGLAEWVLDKNVKRNDLITANREGLSSALGYVGLYFLSISIGKLINSRYNKNIHSLKLIFLLSLSCISLLVSTLICEQYFGVSRRLASTGYCLWVTFVGTFGTLIFALIEICLLKIYIFFSIKNQIHIPLICEAINYNGLLFFLVANVLTGLINVLVIDHKEGSIIALIILFVYMIINCGVVTLLFKHNIKITRSISELFNRTHR